jgi:RND family efflux transporter MFP subunit
MDLATTRRRQGAIALAAALVLYSAGCGKKPDAQKWGDGEAERVTPVRVASVEHVDVLHATIEVTGTVMALEEVRIFAKVPGRLESLRVNEGDRVTSGQPVATIEREAIETQVRSAKAGLDVARASAAAAAVGLESATKEVRRMRTLFESGSITQQQLDGVETAYRSAAARNDLAQAQVKQVAAQVEAAKIQLDECTVKSPLEGIVLEDYDHAVGGMISPAAPVLHVADVSKVKVVVRVSEEQLGLVEMGRDAYVSVARFPGRRFAGKITSISPAVDVRSRTTKVEILADNPLEGGAYALKPGMFASASIVTAQASDVLVVWDSAVQTEEGKPSVVFVVESERARRRVVTTGLAAGKRVVVTEGLSEGDTVVVEGAAGLVDGTRVKTEGASRE